MQPCRPFTYSGLLFALMITTSACPDNDIVTPDAAKLVNSDASANTSDAQKGSDSLIRDAQFFADSDSATPIVPCSNALLIDCPGDKVCDERSGKSACVCREFTVSNEPGLLTFDVTADTTIFSGDVDRNFGEFDSLTIGTTDSAGEAYSLLSFGMFSSCTRYEQIYRAELVFEPRTPAYFFYGAHATLQPWSETETTWRTQPAVAPPTGASIGRLGETQHRIDITRLVNAWNDEPEAEYGMMLRRAPSQPGVPLPDEASPSVSLYSKEGTGQGVQLIVAVNPIRIDVPLSADSYLHNQAPDTNFGTSTSIKIGIEQNNYFAIVLKPDLSSIPAGSKVIAASLSLKKIGGFALFGGAGVRPITEPWNETTVTWNTKPASSDSVFSTNGRIAINLTSTVTQWLDGSLANHGVLIEMDRYTNVNSWSLTYGSREHPTEGSRPVLSVWYAPPSS